MPPKRTRIASAIALVVMLITGTAVWVLTTSGSAGAPWSLRINAASSSDFVSSDGERWLADRHFVGGNGFGWPQAIADTTDDPLYSKHRWGMSGYDIPVPSSAKYRVDLHFSEITFDQPGKRVFDVSAEGKKYISALDVVDVAGPRTAHVESFEVTVSDGNLDLDFGRIVEDPFISGIRIQDVSTGSTTQPSSSAGVVKRITAASSRDYTDSAGQVWSADQGYNGGHGWAGGFTVPVKGTTDPALYQKHRWGMTGYSMKVPNGTYDVTLHFAEVVFRDPGKRVFNIRSEGKLQFKDVDVIKEAGHARALEKSFRVTVEDGRLNIRFVKKVEDPMVSAIEVVGVGGRASAAPTTAAPTTAAPTTTKAPTTTAAPPTTAAPAPAPAPAAPTGSSRCPAYPAFPDGNCTGVIPGTVLKACDGNVTQSGAVYENCRFSGDVRLAPGVRNVTIRNSYIAGITRGNYENHNITLIDVEIAGGGGTPLSAFDGLFGINCTRCNIHHVAQGVSGPNMRIVDSWIHDLWGEGRCEPCTHMTAALIYTGNVVISHSNLEAFHAPGAGGGISSAVSMYTHGSFWPDLDNVLIENSRFYTRSAAMCLYGGWSTGPDGDEPSNIRVINNVWDRASDCQPYTDWYRGNGNVWSGNRWSDGTPIN